MSEHSTPFEKVRRSPDVLLTSWFMWADKSALVGCGKIDARVFSDARHGLLFTGQIAFAAKMSSGVR